MSTALPWRSFRFLQADCVRLGERGQAHTSLHGAGAESPAPTSSAERAVGDASASSPAKGAASAHDALQDSGGARLDDVLRACVRARGASEFVAFSTYGPARSSTDHGGSLNSESQANELVHVFRSHKVHSALAAQAETHAHSRARPDSMPRSACSFHPHNVRLADFCVIGTAPGWYRHGVLTIGDDAQRAGSAPSATTAASVGTPEKSRNKTRSVEVTHSAANGSGTQRAAGKSAANLKLWLPQSVASTVAKADRGRPLLLNALPAAISQIHFAKENVIGFNGTSANAPAVAGADADDADSRDALNLVCVVEIALADGVTPCALAVSSSRMSVCVGCTDGSVLVLSGDLCNPRSLAKRRVVCNITSGGSGDGSLDQKIAHASAIVWLGFVPASTKSSDKGKESSAPQRVEQAVFVASHRHIGVLLFDEVIGGQVVPLSTSSSSAYPDPLSDSSTSHANALPTVAALSTESMSGAQATRSVTSVALRHELLEGRGLPSRACVSMHKGNLVVARKEGLFFFTRDGLGQCLAFQTEDQPSAHVFKENYLLVLSTAAGASVYDLAHRVVALRAKQIDIMGHGFELPGEHSWQCVNIDARGKQAGCLVLSLHSQEKAQSALYVTERPLRQRVQVLTDRGLFVQARELAETEDYLDETVGSKAEQRALIDDITALYGKSLLGKRLYNAAASEFCKLLRIEQSDASQRTDSSLMELPNPNPNWVIQQLINQTGKRSALISYLKAMHETKWATRMHTKLLVSCFSHQHAGVDSRSISHEAGQQRESEDAVFLAQIASNLSKGHDTGPFSYASGDSVDDLIEACRIAGMADVALRIATERGRNEHVARILLLDTTNPRADDAILALGNVPSTEELLHILCTRRYELGRILLRDRRAQLVHLIIRCTHRDLDACRRKAASSSKAVTRVEELPFVQFFQQLCELLLDCPHWRAELVTHFLALFRVGELREHVQLSSLERIWHVYIDALMGIDMAQQRDMEDTNGSEEAESEHPVDACQFCPHQRLRMHAAHAPASPTSHSVADSQFTPAGSAALVALQNPLCALPLVDALALAERHGHVSCLLYAYESLRMYRELAVLLRRMNLPDAMLEACRRHGDREPLLWIEALRLFLGRSAQSTPLSAESSTDLDTPDNVGSNADRIALKSIMKLVFERGVMTPSELLNDVAASGIAYDDVREFFERVVQQLSLEAADSTQRATELEARVRAAQKEEMALLYAPVCVSPQRCASCDATIELPFVYFACTHAFHYACVAELSTTTMPLQSRDSSRLSLTPDKRVIMSSVDAVDDATGVSGVAGAAGNMRNNMAGPNRAGGLTCPLCAPDADAAQKLVAAMDTKAQMHEEFFRMLEESTSRLDTLMHYVSKRPLSLSLM
ncbi:Vacuolar protein-sorting-associated protein 11-like [Porphyridium purpureum]|uniref:Vacuolar protein-sorting-associated protein 11-like n=1 Tax=Porphyridium purpureum TaxID=35688 RepID=A0A5J4YVG0_PORPP|nr:Vacuolar protein-sorting-associated protein 11-like [Porphyridium purpureum]|eukprot:POR5915..scf227_4